MSAGGWTAHTWKEHEQRGFFYHRKWISWFLNSGQLRGAGENMAEPIPYFSLTLTTEITVWPRVQHLEALEAAFFATEGILVLVRSTSEASSIVQSLSLRTGITNTLHVGVTLPKPTVCYAVVVQDPRNQSFILTASTVFPHFPSLKFFLSSDQLLRSMLKNTGKTGNLEVYIKWKGHSTIHHKNWKTKQCLGIFLLMVKPNSESLSLLPPLPRATKPKATTPEQDVYFLECHWIPAVCFPPEITREQTHGKGKQRALGHSLPYPQDSASAQLFIYTHGEQLWCHH